MNFTQYQDIFAKKTWLTLPGGWNFAASAWAGSLTVRSIGPLTKWSMVWIPEPTRWTFSYCSFKSVC
jgi:hypothetical protein